MKNFTDFAAKVSEDSRLSDLIDRYDTDTNSLTDEELSEMVDRFDAIDDDYLDEYYENYDNLEMGFDPYMGCYSYDC